jgi:hypothetical protein
VLERTGRRRQTAIQRSTLWRSDQGERKSARHPPNGSAKVTSEVRGFATFGAFKFGKKKLDPDD